MSSSVTIWTEGGPSIGMGHISRSLNLADHLRGVGLDVDFFLNGEAAASMAVKGRGYSFSVHDLAGNDGVDEAGEVVVIDTKRDVSMLARSLRASGRRVLLIDNFTSACEVADKVIIPSPLYVPAGDDNLNTLFGSDYTMIGSNFVREGGPAPSHSLPLKVLITMGGADPNNITELCFKALYGMEGVEATIVIGPASNLGNLVRRIEGEKGECNIKTVSGVRDLAPYMGSSHIGITALGITIFEFAVMGIPSIVLGNYEEDRGDLERLGDLGIGTPLGYYKDVSVESLREAVKRYRDDLELFSTEAARCSELFDGKGTGRVGGTVLELLDKGAAS